MSEKNSPFKYFICGGLGGVLGVALGHPMDTIKVRLQTMPLPKPGEPPLYIGTIDCMRKTVQIDGFKSLFRGMMAPLVVAAPVNAINFFGFSLGKKLMEKDIDHIHTIAELCAAGSFSGIFASIFVGPSEHVKCLLQIQDDGDVNRKYKGTVDCFKKLYAQGGIKNVFKGTMATILRDAPGSAVYFMSYESLIEVIVSEDSSSSIKMIATIFAGGFAGICYSLVAMPADVLKTRLQSAPEGTYKGTRDVFKHLMSTEGPRALFTGITPVMIRAFPVNAASFVGLEVGFKLCDWIIPDF